MDETIPAGKAVFQLGFWAAALVALLNGLFFLSLAIGNTSLMYTSSFLLAPAFVAMLVTIHHYAPQGKKAWSHLGLSFAIIYAVMCSLTYYFQLTVIQINNLNISADTLLPFVFIPGTPMFAQDMLGYVFLCAATLVAGPVFSGGKLEQWIKWLFIFNGILFLIPTLLIPAIPMPVNEAGTGLGDQIGRYSNMVWSAYFATAATLVAVLFRRLQNSFQPYQPPAPSAI